jgi:hypothetical protein
MASAETVPDIEEPEEQSDQGKVRLRRFAALMIPATLAGGALVALTAQGVLASQLELSGIAFTVTADHLHGDGFEQWGWIDNTSAAGAANQPDNGGQITVVISAIHHATLSNFCQSINLGAINLVLRAGRTAGNPVVGTNLVVDSDQLSGDATFGTLEVGNDAGTLNDVPGIVGPDGDFGQQAKTVDIDHLYQENYATTAGSFTLPGLSMSFQSDGCSQ